MDLFGAICAKLGQLGAKNFEEGQFKAVAGFLSGGGERNGERWSKRLEFFRDAFASDFHKHGSHPGEKVAEREKA